MAIFKGAGVAIVTPFNEDGSVNYDKLGELIDFNVNNGTDCIIIVGTTGEGSTLSHEEHIECIRYAVAKTAHRIPVIAGTGSNCTETEVYLSKEAYKAGVDGVLLVSPYYNKATQRGLKEHFGAVAKACDVPMVLYNVPSRTGVNIQARTIAELAKEYDTVVGVKEATGNIPQTMELMELMNGDFDVYSGEDGLITPLLSVGAIGVISVLSNIAPRATHDICRRFFDGDVKGSLELQMKYLPLVRALFCEVNPIPVKTALNLMGFNVGPLRLPLTPMEDADLELLKRELKNVGLIR
ncbi:MAG: 4-hydroxy-tetrahydrodipicolinate synthase [Lachnospiraceae bacterium]|nr:4-hydroxy-tetrahydrodipicolinate synthase [Lachnospiraceae bacterium]